MLKKRIMIVDDAKDLAYMMKVRLENDGLFDVDVFSDGVEALKHAKSNRYDLVITDFSMPRMGGDALLVSLKKNYPSTPVAIYSIFYDDDSTIVPAIRQQADLILKKPITDEEIAKIKELLSLRRTLNG